jgi:hypothetical protein
MPIHRFSNAEGDETSGEEPKTPGGSLHGSQAAPRGVSEQGPKSVRGQTTPSKGCGKPELGKPQGRPNAGGESGNQITDTSFRKVSGGQDNLTRGRREARESSVVDREVAQDSEEDNGSLLL